MNFEQYDEKLGEIPIFRTFFPYRSHAFKWQSTNVLQHIYPPGRTSVHRKREANIILYVCAQFYRISREKNVIKCRDIIMKSNPNEH